MEQERPQLYGYLPGSLNPQKEELLFLSFDVNSNIGEAKRCIEVVPEISNLYDELSAIDNLLFMAQLYGVSRREGRKRAEELLKTFGLYEWRDSLFSYFIPRYEGDFNYCC